jgi:hypothetical protein
MPAPTLSSPLDAANDNTSGLLDVTTNQGNGTLYAVVTTSATTPSHAQIAAGQNHLGAAATWAGSQAVASSGQKSFFATGLTASTAYYGHFSHVNTEPLSSTPVSGNGFTTLATYTTAAAVFGRGNQIRLRVGI